MRNSDSAGEHTTGEWLRGYNKHTYWIGPAKKAEVACGRRPSWNGVYRWHLTDSNIRGNASSLVEARQRVELALQGIYQLDLFGFEAPPAPAPTC